MSDKAKTENTTSTTKKGGSRVLRLLAWTALIVLVGAVLGIGLPNYSAMRTKSSQMAKDLDQAQRQLRVERLELKLARAALAARHGDYKAAGQSLTNFFGLMSREFERGEGSALPADAFYDLQPLVEQRDSLVALVGKSDPTAADKLTEAYSLFRSISESYETAPAAQTENAASQPTEPAGK